MLVEEGSNSIRGEVSGKWKRRVEEGVNGLGGKFKGNKIVNDNIISYEWHIISYEQVNGNIISYECNEI